ncbi:MAG: S-adenosyl-methyltransferase [Flavobacteriales bacterium]|nr:S-adenosyl-methyltransferase [Flavobacteriales bacterium]
MNKKKEPVKEKKVAKGPFRKVIRGFQSILTGRMLSERGSEKMAPYILFLALLGILYIANIHFAERTVREMDHVQQELKELQTEYITTRSEIMYNSKQSRVSVALSPQGIKESTVPPKKIVIKKDN